MCNSRAPSVYANLMLLLITLPKSLMILNSLLKTQHFPIPLSVTVSKAKNFFRSPLYEWSSNLGNEKWKTTSENRRKINWWTQSFKKLTRMEISRHPYLASSNGFFSNFFYIFCPYHMKGPKVLWMSQTVV